MGSNCGKEKNVDTTNQCAIGFNGDYNMDGFCAFVGPAGNGYRSQYCSLMSSGAEWGEPRELEKLCNFDNCRVPHEIPPGHCQGCYSILGSGVTCKRVSFTGNPVTCCFNDVDCSSIPPTENPPACYSDGDKKQHACDDGSFIGNYRSINSTDCQDQLFQYCTGTMPTDDPESISWLDRWTINNGGTGSCNYALYRNIFRKSNPCPVTVPTPIPGVCTITPQFEFDSEGYFWGQRLVSEAMSRYQQQGFEIGTLPGFPGYNTWQDFLYNNVCCPYPGLCQNGLDSVCATKTAQRISLNPAVAQWCGCHLPDGEYEDYSVKYNIPPECTPMCNRVGTIPIVGINGEAVTCKQNICLIDGVTVNLINSQIGNGLNFDMICGNCENAQCSCIVSNTTIDISNSTIGGNVIPVSEGCGSLTCSQTNPGITGPATLTVPCGTGPTNPYAEYEAEVAAAQAEAKKNAWLWTLIAIGIALVLIYLIIFIIHPNLFLEQESITIPIQQPINNQVPINIQQSIQQPVRDQVPINIQQPVRNQVPIALMSPPIYPERYGRGLTPSLQKFSQEREYRSINGSSVKETGFTKASGEYRSING